MVFSIETRRGIFIGLIIGLTVFIGNVGSQYIANFITIRELDFIGWLYSFVFLGASLILLWSITKDLKIKPIKKGKVDKKWKNGKKTNWTAIMAISTVILAIVALIGLFLSAQAANRASDITESLLERTPSDSAYIKAKLSVWKSNAAYLSVSSISQNDILIDEFNMYFNILNTGLMETGRVRIVPEHLNDKFNFNPIEIENIEGQKNNQSKLVFKINPQQNITSILGSQEISLHIFCLNCFEQETVIKKNITININY